MFEHLLSSFVDFLSDLQDTPELFPRATPPTRIVSFGNHSSSPTSLKQPDTVKSTSGKLSRKPRPRQR